MPLILGQLQYHRDRYQKNELKSSKLSKHMAQFRHRASAIWFDYGTAEKQLWFRRRARVKSNSEFTDVWEQLYS